MDDDELTNIKLEVIDAFTAAETLLRLAALIDPDDPDGLCDSRGQRNEDWEKELYLAEGQFAVLRRPGYSSADRIEVAKHLCEISAKIEGQLPDEAPRIWHTSLKCDHDL
jgi:hypothetical protein